MNPNHPNSPNFDKSLLTPQDTITHSAVHMNGHLLCAVDVETTGLNPEKHDIVQIAIIPLAPDITPSRVHTPFVCYIKPERPQNIDPDLPHKIHHKVQEACIHGMERWTAVDRFEEWFTNLHLPEKKIIVPLGSNYGSFDLPFIVNWLGGPLCYRSYFRSDFRDTMLAALYVNDGCDSRNIRIPFPKVSLIYLCSIFGIEHPDHHDAAADAYMSAAVYKHLIRWWDYAKAIG